MARRRGTLACKDLLRTV